MNMQDGKGYFRPAENEDSLVAQWDRISDSRYLNYKRNASAGERYLRWKYGKQKKQRSNEIEGQINLFQIWDSMDGDDDGNER